MAVDFRHADNPVNRFAENISYDHLRMRSPIPPKFDSFTARLQWWVNERGYAARGKQGELSKALGIAQPSTSELIAGKSKLPSAEVFMKLCDALKLRPQYLLFEQGPPEGQYLADLDSQEAQLIELFRRLPSDDLRHALLIDADGMLQRNTDGVSAQQSTNPVQDKLTGKLKKQRSVVARKRTAERKQKK